MLVLFWGRCLEEEEDRHLKKLWRIPEEWAVFAVGARLMRLRCNILGLMGDEVLEVVLVQTMTIGIGSGLSLLLALLFQL